MRCTLSYNMLLTFEPVQTGDGGELPKRKPGDTLDSDR